MAKSILDTTNIPKPKGTVSKKVNANKAIKDKTTRVAKQVKEERIKNTPKPPIPITPKTRKTSKRKTTIKTRITNPEKEHRARVCFEYALLGYSVYQIWELVNGGGPNANDPKMYWGITYDNVSQLLQTAKEQVMAKNEEEIPELIKAARERWTTLLMKSMKDGDLTNARLVAKELDRINGIDIIQVKVQIDDIRKKTDEELWAELARLKKEQGET